MAISALQDACRTSAPGQTSNCLSMMWICRSRCIIPARGRCSPQMPLPLLLVGRCSMVVSCWRAFAYVGRPNPLLFSLSLNAMCVVVAATVRAWQIHVYRYTQRAAAAAAAAGGGAFYGRAPGIDQQPYTTAPRPAAPVAAPPGDTPGGCGSSSASVVRVAEAVADASGDAGSLRRRVRATPVVT